MPATLHDFPKQEEAVPKEMNAPTWKAVCLHCGWAFDDIQTFNAVEARAIAHSVFEGHDVEIRFSIVDCLSGVIRASDPRG